MTRIAPALHHLLTTIILLDFFTLTVWPLEYLSRYSLAVISHDWTVSYRCVE